MVLDPRNGLAWRSKVDLSQVMWRQGIPTSGMVIYRDGWV